MTNAKKDYSTYIEYAYGTSVMGGINKGFEELKKRRMSTDEFNICCAVLIRRYTKTTKRTIELLEKATGETGRRVHDLSVIGEELKDQSGKVLNALILIMAYKSSDGDSNRAYKLLRVLKLGPMESLTISHVEKVIAGEVEGRSLIEKLYNKGELLRCGYCGEKKTVDNFVVGSQYCRECLAKSKKNNSKCRLSQKELSAASMAARRVKEVKSIKTEG